MPKSLERQQNGPKGTARGDLDSPPEVSGTLSGHLSRFGQGGGGEHLSSLWQGAESKMVSK